MIDTSQRISTIGKSDLSKHTVKQLRKDVAEMIKVANRINIESGDSELNKGNVDYFLKDFHTNTRGGFSADFNYQHRGKTELRTLYNQLAHYINADVDSSVEEQRQKVGTEKFVAYVNGFDPEDERNITLEDAQEMFDLKAEMPELFDSQDWFYQDIVVAYSDRRRNAKGQIPQSVVDIALQEKRKLMRKNKAYTPQQLKKNIINAIENAQYQSTGRQYSSARKKNRKAARLNRKGKRR